MRHPLTKGASKTRDEGGAAKAAGEEGSPGCRGRAVRKREALKKHQVRPREGVAHRQRPRERAKDPPRRVLREERSGEQEVVMCVVASWAKKPAAEAAGGASGHGTDLRQGMPRIGPAIS